MTIHTLTISRQMSKDEKFKAIKEWAESQARDFFNPMYMDRSVEVYISASNHTLIGEPTRNVNITIEYDDKKDLMDVPKPVSLPGGRSIPVPAH